MLLYLRTMVLPNYAKSVMYYFFPSYHGHTLCDAHIAKLHSIIERALINAQGDRHRADVSSIDHISSAKHLASVVMSSSQQMQVFVLPGMDSTPSLKPSRQSLKLGIRKYHCFQYVRERADA